MSRPRTHYEALGVRPDASLDAIRKAYQAMVLTMHPDRAPSGSQEAFHAVQAAWETLRDALSRKAYDVSLQAEAAKLQIAVSAEVDLDDMSYDAQRRIYTWPCRCSSHFEIEEAALERGVELASCFGCSAHIRVLYQVAE